MNYLVTVRLIDGTHDYVDVRADSEFDAKQQVGWNYVSGGKFPRECTVIDKLTTRNVAGEIVKETYVSSHVFIGQTLVNRDVPAASIARGLINAS